MFAHVCACVLVCPCYKLITYMGMIVRLWKFAGLPHELFSVFVG